MAYIEDYLKYKDGGILLFVCLFGVFFVLVTEEFH